MFELLWKILLVIGSFLGGYVIGFNIILRYNQYKYIKTFNLLLKDAEEYYKNNK
mgnify:FL=1